MCAAMYLGDAETAITPTFVLIGLSFAHQCTVVFIFNGYECDKHHNSCTDVAAFLIRTHITVINTSTTGQTKQVSKC